MKKNLLLFIFSFIGAVSYAQTANITPDTVDKVEVIDLQNLNKIVKGYGELVNTSATSVTFKWLIEVVDAPEEWEFQMCDNNQCFNFGILSNIDASIGLNLPLTLDANTFSIMELGVKPNGVAGCGAFKVTATTSDDPSTELATATYNFKINVDDSCEEITSTEDFKNLAVKLYPNPTSESFTLTENPYVDQVQIFNIVGKQMVATQFINGSPISVSSFPNGLYLVRMLNDKGEVLKTTRLTKR